MRLNCDLVSGVHRIFGAQVSKNKDHPKQKLRIEKCYYYLLNFLYLSKGLRLNNRKNEIFLVSNIYFFNKDRWRAFVNAVMNLRFL